MFSKTRSAILVVTIAILVTGCSDNAGAGKNGKDIALTEAKSSSARVPATDVSKETKDISDWIYILADDSMKGRDTPSSELEKVAVLIANNFRSLGLESGVPDNTFIQRYHLPYIETKVNSTAPNVIGILRGSDPQLKDEYVAFSAHMDHVGVGQEVNGDSIYNGADDNASGTSAVIEIAKMMSSAQPRPKRSMIFLLVSGEEKGLWGSTWFTENPVIPINSIVADLNMDMVGRNKTEQIVVIGKNFSSLGDTVVKVAHANPGLKLEPIDDLWPEEQLFFRSDQYNFAVKGVPILFFFNGIHEDYHMPSDEASKINFVNVARTAKLVALTGLEIANTQEKPKWNEEAYKKIVRQP